MTSRIPQPKPSTSTTGSSSRLPPTKDVKSLHASLVALNAPEITLEELERLCHGPLADALVFLSEHIKGRQVVALARDQIHRLQVGRNQATSNLKAPTGDDGTRSSADRAASRLTGAKKSVEMYQKQLDDRQNALARSQAELERLQNILDDKRRVGLLLNILERKESIRVQRLVEMKGLINELRKTVVQSKKDQEAPLPSQNIVARSMPPLTTLESNHVRDTLIALHAHHVRLSRMVSQARPNEEPNPLPLLRKSIAKRINKSENDREIGVILDKLTVIARSRARQIIGYHSPLDPKREILSRMELQKLSQTNRAKEQELQQLSDLSIGLAFLADHFIRSISVFLQTTSHTIRTSLEEEASQARGFVDILQSLIIKSSRAEGDGEETEPFALACGMRGNVTLRAVLEEVERIIKRVHQRELFLAKASISKPPPSTTERDALIAAHETNQRTVQEQIVKLLMRKSGKADMGYSLVKDVEVLLRETRFLAGSGRE